MGARSGTPNNLVVILPTYNERQTLAGFVASVLAQASRLPEWRVQLLVADSSSPDGTADLVRCLAARDDRIKLLEVPRGLGRALKGAYAYAAGTLQAGLIVQIDADGQSSAEVIPLLVQGIADGYDLVIGSRFVRGGHNGLRFHRRVFSIGSSAIFRLLVGDTVVREVTNMTRAFRPALLQDIDLGGIPWDHDTFVFLPAFLHEAQRRGARCKEVPLVFNDRAQGCSKNRVLRYALSLTWYCMSARLARWRSRRAARPS
jgi:dolichol-phosphate mannosyltransferase